MNKAMIHTNIKNMLTDIIWDKTHDNILFPSDHPSRATYDNEGHIHITSKGQIREHDGYRFFESKESLHRYLHNYEYFSLNSDTLLYKILQDFYEQASEEEINVLLNSKYYKLPGIAVNVWALAIKSTIEQYNNPDLSLEEKKQKKEIAIKMYRFIPRWDFKNYIISEPTNRMFIEYAFDLFDENHAITILANLFKTYPIKDTLDYDITRSLIKSGRFSQEQLRQFDFIHGIKGYCNYQNNHSYFKTPQEISHVLEINGYQMLPHLGEHCVLSTWIYAINNLVLVLNQSEELKQSGLVNIHTHHLEKNEVYQYTRIHIAFSLDSSLNSTIIENWMSKFFDYYHTHFFTRTLSEKDEYIKWVEKTVMAYKLDMKLSHKTHFHAENRKI